MRIALRRTSILGALLGLLLAGAVVSPAHAQHGGESGFISADTVIIGCTAGGGASAFAAVLPLLTTAFGGAGVVVTPVVVGAWTGIGCAVGVVSGLIAIGTAWGMEALNGRPEGDDAAS